MIIVPWAPIGRVKGAVALPWILENWEAAALDWCPDSFRRS